MTEYRINTYRRRNTGATFGGIVAVFVGLCALFYFLGGFVLMTLVGAVHGSWWRSVPTIGYWHACWIALLLRLLLSFNGNGNSNDKK